LGFNQTKFHINLISFQKVKSKGFPYLEVHIYNSFMNFLYCFDNNFNLQALNSINSVIRNSENDDINFYIVHETPDTFLNIIDKYLPKYKNLIKIYKFDFDSLSFPKISGAHVSKATYFRLFFQEYLPKDLDFVTYVDSDIVCLSNPTKRIKEQVQLLKTKDYLLGAVSDEQGQNSNKDRLSMKSDEYFNAGVMVINLRKWRSEIKIDQIISCMAKLEEKILWWDQDILNVLVDGNFLELNDDFNMKVSNTSDNAENSVIFLHYAGKGKPWDNSFFYDSRHMIYQSAFSKTGFSEYHIDPKGIFQNVLFFKYLLFNKNSSISKKHILNSYLKNKLK
jgi:lipopolysaccharide biosynthesis glycosyltransferase